MNSPRARALVVALAATTIASGLAACGSGTAVSSGTPTPTAVATATPTPTPVPTSMLSGRPLPDGPVLALKVENTSMALPHIGLMDADVVYVQQVEGGLTRLAAVYSSTLPKKVAPIRSARETDAELLPMYGPIAFGFSGSVAAVHALVRRAGLVDVSADVGGRGYSRMPSRPAPHNMATVPKTLIERADGSVMPRDVGFTFGPAPLGGTPATAVTAKYPAARITLKYLPATQTWAYSLGGELDRSSEGTVAPTTVIVQSVRMLANVRQDRIGSAVPMSRTVGSGKATILRDGRAYSVTWSRPNVDSPTRWLYQGKDFPMKAGQVWVMLLDAKRKAVVVSPKPSPTPTAPSTTSALQGG